jgi:DnaJ homolog subfamily C member 19
MAKLLLALAVAYAGWWLWQGPKKVWTNGGRGPTRPSQPPTSETDALRVLGLDVGAGEEDIRAAHRRLLLAVHPDRGGSADLTQRINAARDTLLRRND